MPGSMVPPRTHPHRGRIRLLGRSEPYTCLLGKYGPLSTQSRRTQSTEQCPAHECSYQYAPRRRDPCICSKTTSRTQTRPRNPTVPQPLHRPPHLPNPQRCKSTFTTDLTDIEESCYRTVQEE